MVQAKFSYVKKGYLAKWKRSYESGHWKDRGLVSINLATGAMILSVWWLSVCTRVSEQAGKRQAGRLASR